MNPDPQPSADSNINDASISQDAAGAMEALVAAGESPVVAMHMVQASMGGLGGFQSAVAAERLVANMAPVKQDNPALSAREMIFGQMATVKVMAEGAIALPDDAMAWLHSVLADAKIHPLSLPMALQADRPDDAKTLACKLGVNHETIAAIYEFGDAGVARHAGSPIDIPDGLRFPDYVNLDLWAHPVRKMGDHMLTEGKVLSLGQVQLERVGCGVMVDGNFNFTDCVNLRQIGEGLVVLGNLTLSGCRSLNALPDNSYIQGDVSIAGTGIAATILRGEWQIPEGTKIQGNIILDDHTGKLVMDSARNMISRYRG